MEDRDKTILIGVPSYSGYIPVPTVQSLLQLHKPTQCAFLTVERQRIDKVRSYMAMECLKGGFDYLMMIDDDNPVPVDTLELMTADDKDVVIAPILARNPNEQGKFDLCAYYKEIRDVKGSPLNYYNHIEKFKDPSPLHEIDTGGTGCILIKRKVLEALNKKYAEYIFEFGDTDVNGQRRTMSEDVEFCERAKDLGFTIWLDDRIRPLHLINNNWNQWQPTT